MDVLNEIMANERARELRNNLQEAERKLWYALRRKQLGGHKFRRQHPMGSYVFDFVCLEKKLIIELDGSQHGNVDQIAHDTKRTKWLERRGYRVIRFWNNEVFTNKVGVLDTMLFHLDGS